ncbi:hypothetical protein ACSBR1_019771 [Camellia fascicularis]
MGKTSSLSEQSTHADRKFEKKLQFYASKFMKSNSKTKKKVRSRKKKLKAYDLTTLSEFLPDLKAPMQPAPTEFKLNSKSRQNLVLKEANQLKTVLDHPAFQSDPLAAIHQHLQSTQPVTDVTPGRKNVKSGKKKAKKKKPKISAGPQSMEI